MDVYTEFILMYKLNLFSFDNRKIHDPFVSRDMEEIT